jgi:hypothetical protein
MKAYTDTNPARKSPTGSRHNAAGASNRCGNTCVRPTPSQAHCAALGCHRTFGGVTGFDAHRKDGECINPTTLGMVLSDHGIWRTPMSDEARERLEAAR